MVAGIVAMLSMVGCNGNTVSPDSSMEDTGREDTGVDGWGFPTTTACADYANAVCERMATCSNGYEVLREFGSMQSCVSRVVSQCLVQLTTASSSASPLFVDGCAAGISMQSCTDWRTGVVASACTNSGGPLPEGAHCVLDAQCQSGVCLVPVDGTCGACGPQPAEGAACSATGCGHGLVCVTDPTTMAQTCRRPSPVGGTCDADHPCIAGTGCVVSASGATMGSCQALAAMAGAPCNAASVGMADCDGFLGLYCATNGQCATAMAVPAGSSCAGSGAVASSVICTNGATCFRNGATGASTCVAAAMDGQPCDPVAGPGCLPLARCLASGGDAGSSVCVSFNPIACHL